MGEVHRGRRLQQEHHRDYLNHTPLVPSANARYRGLEMFIWLNDVPEARGPTHIVPMTLTSNFPALPHGYLREQQPEMYERDFLPLGWRGRSSPTARIPSTEVLK